MSVPDSFQTILNANEKTVNSSAAGWAEIPRLATLLRSKYVAMSVIPAACKFQIPNRQKGNNQKTPALTSLVL